MAGTGDARPQRRKRYAGRFPRRFEERYKELDPATAESLHSHLRAQGRTPAGTHIPIMVEEVLRELRPGVGDTVMDCTIGYGGHAMAFLRRIGPEGRLIGCDVDEVQLARTRERLRRAGFHPHLHRVHFAGLGQVLRAEGLDGFDVLFADLGVSSMQLDDPARGFSYKQDGPLDMRMDHRLVKSAADLLAKLSFTELSDALRDLADEPDHERIARHIVRRRTERFIQSTRELVNIVLEAKGLSRRGLRRNVSQRAAPLRTSTVDPKSEGAAECSPSSEERMARRRHPAAKTFQALRILVNDELGGLAQLLRIAPYCLKPGGRLGVISFHSGEDRLVKRLFRDGLRSGMYVSASETPIRPTRDEVRANPRAASAKFRVAVRA